MTGTTGKVLLLLLPAFPLPPRWSCWGADHVKSGCCWVVKSSTVAIPAKQAVASSEAAAAASSPSSYACSHPVHHQQLEWAAPLRCFFVYMLMPAATSGSTV